MSEKMDHGFREVDYNLSVVIFRLVHLQRCFYWDLAKEHGITPLQMQIVFTLCVMPDTVNTITSLAEMLRRPKPPVSESFYGLEQKGFVKRESHPRDRRSYILSLTQTGTDFCVAGFEYYKMLKNHFEQFSPEEQVEMCCSFVKVLDSLYQAGVMRFINACFSCCYMEPREKNRFYCKVYDKEYGPEEVEFRCPWQKHCKSDKHPDVPVPSRQKEREVEKNVTLAMMRFADFEWVIFGELAKQFRISPIQFHMIVMLRYFPERINTISNFAKLLCVSKPAISEAVSYMVKRGVLNREARKADRRYRVLKLTAKGNRLAEKVLHYHKQVVSHLQVLPDEERVKLYVLLLDLIEKLSDSGAVAGVWICNTCRYFERDRQPGVHYCNHFQKEMSNEQLQAFCLEYRSTSDTLERLLQLGPGRNNENQ